MSIARGVRDRGKRLLRGVGALLALGRETFCIAGLSLLLFLLLTGFIGRGYEVQGRCMEPHLYTGERVLGEKLTFHLRRPGRGDVVIFRHPHHPSQLYIKRIIALGGETVAIRAGRVYVNGAPLSEPYATPAADFPPHRVLPGRYFVLGDNRAASDDSRHWGDVRADAVLARACARYWPPHRWNDPLP